MSSTTSRFDPMKEMANLREQVSRVLEDTFGSGSSLPLDIYETDDAIVVETVPLLGLRMESLDIQIADGQLTISGEREAPAEVDAARYLRRERKFGPFSRTVMIPQHVVAEEAHARLKDHMLVITIPKVAETNPRVIKVTPIE
ncbi:MAG: Hsp20/alpha crystallin family protein [Anaerolineae bacterium]|nr:Hsp20/alpha crystallin family protein [Anaerolineae bacterium]